MRFRVRFLSSLSKLLVYIIIIVYLATSTMLEAAANNGVIFLDSGQRLGNRRSWDVALGDLDGDNDLDAFVANSYWYGGSPCANTVWLNDGAGIFTDSGQRLGLGRDRDAALGDLDDDGDLDAVVPGKVWLNDGTATFIESSQQGPSAGLGMALGDIDGDGDLDAFVADQGPNRVWLNDGTGTFVDSGQSLGSSSSWDVALGDVDDDGDLDAFLANWRQPNKVWLNDGAGIFTDSSQNLGGQSEAQAVALGDLDGDGDLDAVVAPGNVWLNDGTGTFIDSGQDLGGTNLTGIALGDLDADGDLDAVIPKSKVWLNDGTGTFIDSGQSLGHVNIFSVALGDLDGDRDLDVFLANWTVYTFPYYPQPNEVWLNILDPYPPNSPPVANAGGPYVANEGQTFTLDASSSTDPDDNIASLEWDLDNDGECDDATGVTTEIAFDDNGIFTVGLRVTDECNESDTDTAEVTVLNVPPTVDTPMVVPEPSDEGSAVTASATFSDPGVNDAPFTCSVNYGDGSGDLTGTVSGNTCTGPAHTYADNGSYPVTVSVTDKDGDAGSNTATHVVNNVAPTVGEISAPTDPVQMNTEISASADFTDPGVLDTHTAVWDWGDDTTSPGTVNEANSSGSVAGSHTYTAAGVYTVRLTVTDKDGGSDQSVFQYVVVYDPEGGFVTGGGWIDSPAGAYTPDPSLTGKATFGFAAKYKKGADTPSGNTEFQFRVADLNFHSDTYQWLVVAGPKAQFKGTGTINGAGNYGFILSAIDAELTPSTEVDRFRIKIWDMDNSDTIVYDNQMEADDDADPATAIGGGSIVIHKGK